MEFYANAHRCVPGWGEELPSTAVSAVEPGRRNQTPQWVLVRACWTADLSAWQSGKWNVKNDLYQAQFWVKALLFKALSGV